MAEEQVKRKLTAILSADVAGYTRLMRDDEVATVNTLSAYRQLMSELILQYRGRVVDNPGDNILAEFSSVVDAVQSAVAIQKELRARNASLPENRKMKFRIGINIGDVIQEGDRIYGDGVNIAARLEGLAEPGGICISRTAYDQIEDKLPLGYEYLGEKTVKNVTKPLHAYRVILETEDEAHRARQETKSGPTAQAEAQADRGHTFEQVKEQIRDFAKDISGDEQIGETFGEIKDKFRGFARQMSSDREHRHRAIQGLLKERHLRFFLGLALLLFVLNLITSFGNWWFRYPVISIGLVIYLHWLRASFFSSDKIQEMRQKMLEKEIAHFPKGSQDIERGQLERRITARVHFYMHLFTYVGVNAFLILMNLITSPLSWWFQFPLVGWGIAVFFHWMGMNRRWPIRHDA